MMSSEANARIAGDLGRNLAAKLQDVIQREVSIAQAVLPTTDVTMMLMRVTEGVSIATILVALQCRAKGVDPAPMFDLTQAALDEMVRNSKADALEALQLMEAGNLDQARGIIRRRGL